MESGDEEYYYSDEDEYMNEYDGTAAAAAASASDIAKPSAVNSASDAKTKARSGSSASSSAAAPAAASAASAGVAASEEYSVLKPETLRAEQDKVVRNVADILDTSYDAANVLLLHFKWNKERLLEGYYADPDGACKAAGALRVQSSNPDHAHSSDADAAAGDGSADSSFLCPILYIEVPRKFTLSMGCRGSPPATGQDEIADALDGPEHRYSADAWQSYLCTKVEAGKDCVFARCPAEGCKATISPNFWENALTHPVEDPDAAAEARNKDALARYRRFLAESFVDINKNVRWCPGTGCDCAVQASGAVREVLCAGCSLRFCFKCGSEAHAPVTCEGLSAWQEKCMNESETANWILAHTKKCPKCATRIEKNQGCNHMTCKVCKFDFCWICMMAWNEHGSTTGGYYNCNKYRAGGGDLESSSSNGGNSEADRAKKELDRYLHYYKRYAAHEQAGKFAKDQRAKAEQRMVAMQSAAEVGWIDVQFLEQAVEQLIECRRVLKYTYAFAYFLPEGKKKDLFEFNQSLLESNTERLSELSELPLDKMDRANVINFTRVTGKFLRSLLEQVEVEGIEADPAAIAIAQGKLPPGAKAGAAAASSSSSSSSAADVAPKPPSQKRSRIGRR